jgi:hypothetical protein
MAGEEYIELIHKEISGTITPDERKDLYDYLRKNPDAQRLHSQLRRTSDLLNKIRDVEPPTYLKKRIMNSIDFTRYQASRSRPVLRLVTRVRQIGLRPRFAYAFALGVVVGLVVFSQFLIRPGGKYATDLRNLYGTIGLIRDSSFTMIDRVPVDLAQIEGYVDLLRYDDVLIFDVSLYSSGKSEILLEYEPDLATFGGLRPGDHGSVLMDTGRDYVKASGAGDLEFDLCFLKEPTGAARFGLRLSVYGKPVHSHRFLIEAFQE